MMFQKGLTAVRSFTKQMLRRQHIDFDQDQTIDINEIENIEYGGYLILMLSSSLCQ